MTTASATTERDGVPEAAVRTHVLGAVTILEGDVCASLATLPADHFHCCVTSPPYWALRSYLKTGDERKALEIGQEPTPGAFVSTLVDVFRCVRRVLRPDGLCFVNVGDSYATGAGKANLPGGGVQGEAWPGETEQRNRLPIPGLKPGNLCLIPQRLALAFQADGWYVRQLIIWHKPAPTPESVSGTRWERCRVKAGNAGEDGQPIPANWKTGRGSHRPDQGRYDHEKHNSARAEWSDCPGCPKCRDTGGYVLRHGFWRCTTAHEFILMLAKSQRYFADQQAVMEDATDVGRENGRDGRDEPAEARPPGSAPRTLARLDYTRRGRNPRSVWTIGPERLSEPHYAAFPSELPKRCIAVATSAKGCCPTCGAQWARVIDHTNSVIERSQRTSDKHEVGLRTACGGTYAAPAETRTLGFRPTCACPTHQPIPCRVLDPFGGSGTTALQALAMNRSATVCELSPQYVAMNIGRIFERFGLLVSAGGAP